MLHPLSSKINQKRVEFFAWQLKKGRILVSFEISRFPPTFWGSWGLSDCLTTCSEKNFEKDFDQYSKTADQNEKCSYITQTHFTGTTSCNQKRKNLGFWKNVFWSKLENGWSKSKMFLYNSNSFHMTYKLQSKNKKQSLMKLGTKIF